MGLRFGLQGMREGGHRGEHEHKKASSDLSPGKAIIHRAQIALICKH